MQQIKVFPRGAIFGQENTVSRGNQLILLHGFWLMKVFRSAYVNLGRKSNISVIDEEAIKNKHQRLQLELNMVVLGPSISDLIQFSKFN